MSKSARIPEWLVERVALGEVPSGQRERVSEWRATGAAEARLEELAASDRAILAAHPPARVAAEVERRSSAVGPTARASAGWMWGGAGAALVTSAAVLFLVLARSGDDETAPGGSSSGGFSAAPGEAGSERIKSGEPYLRIHRQLAQGTEPIAHGQLVHSGDRLQLAYVALGMEHGVILSFDGRGEVTLHYPDSRAADTALTGGKPTIFLADSYELDDAPEFERFFFVTSPRAIDIEAVRRAAAQLASQPRRAQSAKLDLAPEQRQSSFLLRKASSR